MLIKLRTLATLAVLVSLLVASVPTTAVQAQEEEQDEVAQLMARMSAAAKVGQLFLVTFPGGEVTEDALIKELIEDYRISGVLLLPESGNIDNEGNTPEQVASLVGQLQQTAWMTKYVITDTLEEGASTTEPFLPLLVAVNHEGNGMPFTSIINGMTPLASAMALGATWDPTYAEAVGRITGEELRALGINMLLGPSLDVLETPLAGSAGDLGVRTFGGEPFWVGQMGSAYIRGVHTGSEGQIAVIAKHFPGLGSSDRSLQEEAPTVQRTLEELKQIDLAPFFDVALSNDDPARADGVLVSHIRFRGLEGGRFVTTRPLSVDSQVLQRLLQLPELAPWRESGGVTVSDELGIRALRRFYDPREVNFNNRRIAQEAFLAGNDILILSQFGATDDWRDQFETVKSTITFFQEKYEAEPSFQALVDEAVARILKLKLELYDGRFELAASRPDLETVQEHIGNKDEELVTIARAAITLLSPPSYDLAPSPPTVEDYIVIFTDSSEGSSCATCQPVPYIAPEAVQDTIARLYGPQATGQINPALIRSFSFDQLAVHMATPHAVPELAPDEDEMTTPEPLSPVEFALQRADWIIFVMLTPADDTPQSGPVRQFLSEYADELRGPQLIVMAYDAPYYLDATGISKLGAYYVAYSRTEPFIEASVRALFGEFAPTGSPPVDVPGINYNLRDKTAPNPDQIITVELTEPVGEGTPTVTPPQITVGDELSLKTSIIVDHNGHPIPDGTPVQFILTYPQEGLERSVTEISESGIAQATVMLERTGQLEVFIQSEAYPRTLIFQITIKEGESATIVPVTVTPSPTEPLPTATHTPEVEPPLENTPSPTPNLEPTEPPPSEGDHVDAVDLLLAMISIAAMSGVIYFVARIKNLAALETLRMTLWCVTGGLALYLGYAIRLPGADWLHAQTGRLATVGASLVGSTLPFAVMIVLRQFQHSEQEL